ncbi:MAG: flagellar filament capping protein FliD [Thauera sp.]|jgi:flagellar hook-associated protein 2|nr:flagellar filament capping protein FliD [Thauera sp.]
MAAITSSGQIIDVTGIVSQLIAAERVQNQQPLVRRETTETTKLSAFGQIKGALGGLQSAVDALGKADLFGATKATVSGKGFTATAKAGTAASSHSIEVLQMASAQRLATDASTSFAPADGKLSIQFGKMDGDNNFISDGSRTAILDFEGSTLAELRDAINKDHSLGIKASLINNGTAEQLVLTGDATGEDMVFKLDGLDGLAGLSYDPADGASSGQMQVIEAAQDARIKVDGIEISRGKNTIDDVIEGLTLTLTEAPEAGAAALKGSVSIAPDNEEARKAIEAFVKAYNEVNETLRGLTAYDPSTREASILTGDSTVRNVQTTLRTALNDSLGSLGGISSLAELGISMGKTETDKDTGKVSISNELSFDSAKFTTALANPDKDVVSFFAGKDGAQGMAARFSARLDGLLNSSSGILTSRTNSINENIKSIQERYERVDERISRMEERYRLEFSRLDSLLAGMSQTSSYLMQQLASLPKIGN